MRADGLRWPSQDIMGVALTYDCCFCSPQPYKEYSVCVCAYTYIYAIYIYISHTYMHTYIHTCMHACMHAYLHMLSVSWCPIRCHSHSLQSRAASRRLPVPSGHERLHVSFGITQDGNGDQILTQSLTESTKSHIPMKIEQAQA